MNKVVLFFAIIISVVGCKSTTPMPIFVAIPDPIFEQYLVDNKIDKDGTVNGKMNVEDAKGVTSIDIHNKVIKSLVGVEAFTDLQKLYCYGSYGTITPPQLTSLDVSKNVALKELNCYNNQIKSLDVSKNITLQFLHCGYNKLRVCLKFKCN